jgi:DNA-binding response OmpR family regulator
MKTIYLCEDDLALGEAISDLLIIDGGFRVSRAFDGDELRELLAESTPDLLILDIQLPGESGIEIAGSISPYIPNVPIMFLSAFASVENRISAAHAGGITFLAKPFEPEELLAIAKRLTQLSGAKESSGSIENKILRVGSDLVKLTDREVQMMRLMTLAGEVGVEYHSLMDVVGITFDDRGMANLEVAISRLRKKLSEVNSPSMISNKTGYGYQLSNPPVFS